MTTARLPNGEPKSGSPVASTLIYGSEHAVLTDPGYTTQHACDVGDWVKSKGRKLTDIFITHGHGNHWFAAGLLAERFGARVIATEKTITQMHASVSARPLLWDKVYPGIPPSPVTAVTVPDDRFQLEGHDLLMVEVGHADTDDNSVLHIPDLGLVVAGDVIYNGAHVYIGESVLVSGFGTWRAAIDMVQALEPQYIVAGHQNSSLDDDAWRTVAETRQYLDTAEHLLRTERTAVDFSTRWSSNTPSTWRGRCCGRAPALCMGCVNTRKTTSASFRSPAGFDPRDGRRAEQEHVTGGLGVFQRMWESVVADRKLPNPIAFWILSALFLMLFFASAAASPLYPVYQVQFGFSAATLTAVFAVYVLVLLVTLLFFGSLSDYVGRLPVILAALAFSAAGCLVFLTAVDVAWLFLARALQGIATGLASGAIGAALLELQPVGSQRAGLVTSAFSTLGLALGALITGLLVEDAPAPTELIWWTLLALFVLGILAVLAIAEPSSRRPGVLASLRPRVAVPSQARGAFVTAIPCVVAVWSFGGLLLSLGPSLAAEALASSNPIWGGLAIFLLYGTGAAATLVLRGINSRSAMLAGCLFLFAGAALTFGGVATDAAPVLIVSTVLAGVGVGLAFPGAFRMTIALAPPAASAGLVAANFVVAYLAFSVPALVAGAAATRYGLHVTALVYCVLVSILASAAAAILLRDGALKRASLQTHASTADLRSAG